MPDGHRQTTGKAPDRLTATDADTRDRCDFAPSRGMRKGFMRSASVGQWSISIARASTSQGCLAHNLVDIRTGAVKICIRSPLLKGWQRWVMAAPSWSSLREWGFFCRASSATVRLRKCVGFASGECRPAVNSAGRLGHLALATRSPTGWSKSFAHPGRSDTERQPCCAPCLGRFPAC